jgi:hypothetical protein
MRFAKWVFLLAGVSGILLAVPPYFLERQTGEDYPPPITHPEYYYGFFGVTLAWQVMFLVIASDPVRYRRAMLPAILEKAGFAVAISLLHATGRVCRRVGRVRGDARDLAGAVRGCLFADAEGAAPGRQGLIGG